MKTRIAAFFLACCLVFGLSVSTRADYTYTVRFYSGRQGTFDGQEVIVFDGLHYGDRVSFRLAMVTLLDGSKYYIKGIRESGKDNNTVGLTSFRVTKDQDYTVAYGILGDSVAYTINYLDQNGVSLAPSETYYGNVGDKPVIAYQYIEDYEPEFYNITRTLSDNAAENTFDFIYHAVAKPEGKSVVVIVEESGDDFVIVPGGTEPDGGEEGSEEGPDGGLEEENSGLPGDEQGSGSGPDGGEDPAVPGEDPAVPGEDPTVPGEDPAVPGEDVENPPESQAGEILDLDPQPSPVPGEIPPGTDTQPRSTPWYETTGGKVGAVAGAAVLVGGGALLIGLGGRKKRKEREHEKESGS